MTNGSPNYHNATPAERITCGAGQPAQDMFTGDINVFAFDGYVSGSRSDIGPFIEIVTGELVTDPDTGEQTVADRAIRMTWADAEKLASQLIAAVFDVATDAKAMRQINGTRPELPTLTHKH